MKTLSRLLGSRLRLVAATLLIACSSGRANDFYPAGDWVSLTNFLATNPPAAGDTVHYPAGTFTWYGTALNIYGWTLMGAGTNGTFIIDETPTNGNGVPILSITTHPTALSRLTGFFFNCGITNSFPGVSQQAQTPNSFRANIPIYGTNAFRIDHNIFSNLTGKPFNTLYHTKGLVDHNAFYMYANGNYAEVDGGDPSDNGQGDWSWSNPYIPGTDNALFIEDNYFYSAYQFCSLDFANGARAVVRFNDMEHGSFVYTHGTESGQRYRSSFFVECYSNIINHSLVEFDNGSAAITIRGGSALIYGNRASNWWNMAVMQNYRSTANSPYFTPWFGATGQSGYDSNSATLYTGTISSGAQSQVATVAGTPWTTNQWVGKTFYNLSNNLCGVCTSNSQNQAWFAIAAVPAYQLTNTTGDGFVVHNVVHPLDIAGSSYGSLLSGSVPTPVWCNEGYFPIASWGNVAYVSGGTSVGGNLGSSEPEIIAGQNFTNAVFSYTPYTYPHPLTLVTNGSSGYSGPAYTVHFIFNPPH